MKEEDYEEIELPETPKKEEKPSNSELLIKWFTHLCKDIDINKYFRTNDIFAFGDKEKPREYLSLSYITGHGNGVITYRDYSVYINSEESLKLIELFKKAHEAHYSNLIQGKIRNVDYIERERKNPSKYRWS